MPGTRNLLGVPHAHAVRLREGGAELWPPTEPIETVLPPRLALALQTQHPWTATLLTPDDLAKGKQLFAAALRDILGLEEDGVAEHCGYDGEDSGVRAARGAVSKGRKLWHQMAAWPWWYFAPSGRPPDGWRQHGAEAVSDTAFEIWRTGRVSVRELASRPRT